jgi:hypothetical protein
MSTSCENELVNGKIKKKVKSKWIKKELEEVTLFLKLKDPKNCLLYLKSIPKIV